MRSLIIAGFLLVAAGCSAPRVVEHRFPGGGMERSGTVEGTLQTGRWQYFRPDGSRQAEGGWHRDKPDGPWTWWGTDGVVVAEGSYVAGMREGSWSFRHPGGALASRGSYHQDRQEGPWQFTAADGTVLAEGSFSRGLRHGPWLMAGITQTFDQGRPVRALPVPAVPAAPATSAPAPAAPAAVAARRADPEPLPPFTLSPVVGHPALLTERERGKAPTIIATYTHGAQDGGEYAASLQAGGDPAGAALVGRELPQTRFLSSTGRVIDLETASRPTVVVVMRGFSGQVCVYCASQTTALSDQMQRFRDAGVDVLVVYPGPTESVPLFIQAVQTLRADPPPMPIALDVSLLLVRGLGVEDNLAKPTSLIVDTQGVIRYAYVGATMTDRPSVDQLIAAANRLAVPRAAP